MKVLVSILRSATAVVVGYVVMTILVMLTFLVLTQVFPGLFPGLRSGQVTVPPAPWLVAILGLSLIHATVGGWVTGWVAKQREILHVAALSLLTTVLGILNLINESDQQPMWYLVALIIIGVGGAMTGGYLRRRQKVARTATVIEHPQA